MSFGFDRASLLTMDGGRFKGFTEGGNFRLVVSIKNGGCIISENCSLGVRISVLRTLYICIQYVVLRSYTEGPSRAQE